MYFRYKETIKTTTFDHANACC